MCILMDYYIFFSYLPFFPGGPAGPAGPCGPGGPIGPISPESAHTQALYVYTLYARTPKMSKCDILDSTRNLIQVLFC